MAARKSRGKVWNDEETRALITLWCDETIQVALDNSKSSKDTSKVYKTLLDHIVDVLLVSIIYKLVSIYMITF